MAYKMLQSKSSLAQPLIFTASLFVSAPKATENEASIQIPLQLRLTSRTIFTCAKRLTAFPNKALTPLHRLIFTSSRLSFTFLLFKTLFSHPFENLTCFHLFLLKHSY